MNIKKFFNGDVWVTLSERNLITLLNKLKRPDSKRTLYRDTPDGRIVVVAEPDKDHYDGRVESGPVHKLDEPDNSYCKGNTSGEYCGCWWYGRSGSCCYCGKK